MLAIQASEDSTILFFVNSKGSNKGSRVIVLEEKRHNLQSNLYQAEPY